MHPYLLLSSVLVAVNLAAPLADAVTPQFQPCSFPAFQDAVQHFSDFLQFKTVSDPQARAHAQDSEQFAKLDDFLNATYSKALQSMAVERLGSDHHSWLLTWPGSDVKLKPALFISHVDVVPVSEESISDWTYPPFSGAVKDGYIWGRGALDVKIGVVGLLEAVTALINEGFAPHRTLMFAFGHDEEVGGTLGAAAIAKHLTLQGVQFEFIWDEGSSVMADGFPPLVSQPFALVGTSEKQYQTVHVTLHSAGGHSSMPPSPDKSSMAARMGQFLTTLTRNPASAKLVSPTREFVLGLSEVASAWLAPFFAAAKISPVIGGIIASALASVDGVTAAMVRDTAAVTKVAAGVADNVLPQVGTIDVNFRLLPGSTPQTAVGYVKAWLGSDNQHANITLGEQSKPTAVTDPDGPPFLLVKAALQQVWQYRGAEGAPLRPVAVLPFLMPGGTDSKHYQHLTNATLRLCPYSLSLKHKDTRRIHGTDERISLDDFARALCTYKVGLQLAAAAVLPATAAEAAAAAAAAAGGVAAAGVAAEQVTY